jgi:peroxiredoxin
LIPLVLARCGTCGCGVQLVSATIQEKNNVLSLDLADYNGEGRYVLPAPATFVIDRAGVVRAAFAYADYRRRVEPADILAALEALPTPQSHRSRSPAAPQQAARRVDA